MVLLVSALTVAEVAPDVELIDVHDPLPLVLHWTLVVVAPPTGFQLSATWASSPDDVVIPDGGKIGAAVRRRPRWPRYW